MPARAMAGAGCTSASESWPGRSTGCTSEPGGHRPGCTWRMSWQGHALTTLGLYIRARRCARDTTHTRVGAGLLEAAGDVDHVPEDAEDLAAAHALQRRDHHRPARQPDSDARTEAVHRGGGGGGEGHRADGGLGAVLLGGDCEVVVPAGFDEAQAVLLQGGLDGSAHISHPVEHLEKNAS